LWAKSAGGSGDDYGSSVAADGSGNVFITGYFGSSSITFGSITLTKPGDYNMFIVKYGAASGNVTWAKSTEESLWNEGRGIAADANGNIFVTGGFAGNTINFGNNVSLTNRNRGLEIFSVKYDQEGNAQWAKSAGGSKVDIGQGVATDGNGNILVTGYFGSTTITFGTIILSNKTVYANMFIAKYNQTGTEAWVKSAGGTCVSGKPKSADTDINNVPADEMSIYPNPTSGKVMVSATNSHSAINSISVFNVIGKTVLSQQFATGIAETEIDLSSQPKGLYIFMIQAGKDFFSRKIILE
jgi:hypothetical protein